MSRRLRLLAVLVPTLFAWLCPCAPGLAAARTFAVNSMCGSGTVALMRDPKPPACGRRPSSCCAAPAAACDHAEACGDRHAVDPGNPGEHESCGSSGACEERQACRATNGTCPLLCCVVPDDQPARPAERPAPARAKPVQDAEWWARVSVDRGPAVAASPHCDAWCPPSRFQTVSARLARLCVRTT